MLKKGPVQGLSDLSIYMKVGFGINKSTLKKIYISGIELICQEEEDEWADKVAAE